MAYWVERQSRYRQALGRPAVWCTPAGDAVLDLRVGSRPRRIREEEGPFRRRRFASPNRKVRVEWGKIEGGVFLRLTAPSGRVTLLTGGPDGSTDYDAALMSLVPGVGGAITGLRLPEPPMHFRVEEALQDALTAQAWVHVPSVVAAVMDPSGWWGAERCPGGRGSLDGWLSLLGWASVGVGSEAVARQWAAAGADPAHLPGWLAAFPDVEAAVAWMVPGMADLRWTPVRAAVYAQAGMGPEVAYRWHARAYPVPAATAAVLHGRGVSPARAMATVKALSRAGVDVPTMEEQRRYAGIGVEKRTASAMADVEQWACVPVPVGALLPCLTARLTAEDVVAAVAAGSFDLDAVRVLAALG